MTSTRTTAPPAAGSSSDADLIRASLGDPERFDLLFTRHAASIYAFARARVGPDRAEDVTADTFVAAFRARARFDLAATSARPWLYGIAANTLRRHHDVESRWLRSFAASETGSPTDLDGADARLDAGAMAPRLAQALSTLGPDERDVLLMHVLGDMTHAEIALALGIRRGTAKSRLSRGRARLQSLLPDLAREDLRP